MRLTAAIRKLDDAVILYLHRHGHRLHRVSLGVLFIWFGLLKPLGHKTTTSILAHSVWWGDPDTVVLVLGWWEIAIGVCLLHRPLVRVAIILLVVRLPGILIAFAVKTDVCFYSFPFAPTPEGQYLIKDLAIFFATLAIVGSARESSSRERYH